MKKSLTHSLAAMSYSIKANSFLYIVIPLDVLIPDSLDYFCLLEEFQTLSGSLDVGTLKSSNYQWWLERTIQKKPIEKISYPTNLHSKKIII